MRAAGPLVARRRSPSSSSDRRRAGRTSSRSPTPCGEAAGRGWGRRSSRRSLHRFTSRGGSGKRVWTTRRERGLDLAIPLMIAGIGREGPRRCVTRERLADRRRDTLADRALELIDNLHPGSELRGSRRKLVCVLMARLTERRPGVRRAPGEVGSDPLAETQQLRPRLAPSMGGALTAQSSSMLRSSAWRVSSATARGQRLAQASVGVDSNSSAEDSSVRASGPTSVTPAIRAGRSCCRAGRRR